MFARRYPPAQSSDLSEILAMQNRRRRIFISGCTRTAQKIHTAFSFREQNDVIRNAMSVPYVLMYMLDSIINLQPGYAYPVIFFGHIFFGGLVLIPALYLSITNALSFPLLFVLIIVSSALNDSFWYLVGKNIKRERVYSSRFVKNRMTEAEKFSAFYDRHGTWTVFFTKFIYGTRIASHLLAGIHRIHFIKFLIATISGTAVWFTVLYLIIKWLDKGVSGAGSVAFRVQLTFLLAFTSLLLINWFTSTYLKKRMMKPGVKK